VEGGIHVNAGWRAAAFLLALLPGAAQAQDVPAPPPEAPTPDIVFGEPLPGVPSPGGAFLRAMAVPGWGHAAIGSYGRGAFYAGAQTGTAYAFLRTRLRLSEARDRERLREGVLLRRLEAEGVTDPLEIAARLDGDPALTDIRGLVSAREGQQEDWLALGIFLVLLSAADAYVSAHLAHFPEPIEVGVLPGVAGGVELAVRIPVPGP
jgi:hypothetical protein